MITHLQAALAFALTMMALATIVTIIIEMLSRFSRRRYKYLRHTLALVYEQSIEPRLDAQKGSPDSKKVSKDARAFAERIAQSPFEPSRHSFFTKLANWLGAESAEKMTREDFVRRLARDDIGEELKDKVDTDVNEAIEDISLSFDEVADAERKYSHDSNQVKSLLVGIALALVVNIDGIRIYKDFIGDPAKTERFIDQADGKKEAVDDAQKRPGEPKAAMSKGGQGKDSQSDLKQTADEPENAIAMAEQPLSDLTSQGIAMGWKYAPHCEYLGEIKCVEKTLDRPNELVWLVTAIFTGILIGFGGPFWYNVVTGLMRATRIMRGRVPADTVTTGEPAEQPKGAPDIFDSHVRLDEGERHGKALLKRQLRRLKEKIEATGISLPDYSSTQAPPTALSWDGLKVTDEVRQRTDHRFQQYRDTYEQLQAL